MKPLPSAAKGRVAKQEAAGWSPWLRAARTCLHCRTVYRSGGYAWRCEHWHERRSRGEAGE